MTKEARSSKPERGIRIRASGFGQAHEWASLVLFCSPSDFGSSDFGFLPHANIRIRTLRRGLQSVRRQIHVAPAVVSHRVDQMPGLQETGPEGVFFVQFPTKNLDLRREESGVYGPETGQQR